MSYVCTQRREDGLGLIGVDKMSQFIRAILGRDDDATGMATFAVDDFKSPDLYAKRKKS